MAAVESTKVMPNGQNEILPCSSMQVEFMLNELSVFDVSSHDEEEHNLKASKHDNSQIENHCSLAKSVSLINGSAKLCARQMNLACFPEQLCSRLAQLKILSLASNNLEVLPNALSQLSLLETIDFSQNAFKVFPTVVTSLSNLKQLNFSSNKIESLPAEIGHLAHLEQIIAFGNHISCLPSTIGRLRLLQILDLHENMLSHLPQNFGFLQGLRFVDLSQNCLIALPERLSYPLRLEHLDLSGNRLVEIPEKLRFCYMLKYLSLANNILCSLPEWILELPALEELKLQSNNLIGCLVALDSKIAYGGQLRVLDLRKNYIKQLPDYFGSDDFSNLEWLGLGNASSDSERSSCNTRNMGNWLYKIPQDIGLLKNLCHIDLNGINIERLPECFYDLDNLQWLDLGSNGLHDLSESFGKLVSLKHLRLSRNFLELLPSSFGQLVALEELWLGYNRLAELPQSFSQLSNLRTLDLFSNRLVDFPECVLMMTSLTYADLYDNRFHFNATDYPEQLQMALSSSQGSKAASLFANFVRGERLLDGIDRSAKYLTDEEDDGLEEDWDEDSNALVKDGDDLPLRPWTDTEEDWDKELDVACNNSGMASVSSGNISTKTNSPLQREERSPSVDIVGSFGNDESWNTEDDSKSWKYNSKQGGYSEKESYPAQPAFLFCPGDSHAQNIRSKVGFRRGTSPVKCDSDQFEDV